MIGLDFAQAGSAGTDLNLARVVGRRVTQTEQNREYSASPFYYGNGGTKFRKSEILCSARWAASLIVQDHLRRMFARFKSATGRTRCGELGTHSPHACSELLRRSNENEFTLCPASAVDRNESEPSPILT
jgi:hypothetical protein